MSRFRQSRALHLLALLALVAQLLLPMRHAMAMAAGDPLQAAFCGRAATASVQALRASAPVELLQALARSQAGLASQASPACDFCAGLSSVHAAAIAPAIPALHLAREAAPRAPIEPVAAPAPARPHRQPPLRGPPLNT